MRNLTRKKYLGEVFILPLDRVEELLAQLPEDLWQSLSKTFLDNSCGNGNFLVAVLERKLKQGHDPLPAL